MSQQSIFIADGVGSNNTASVTAQNAADGGFSVQSLVAQYSSSAPTLTAGNLTFLQTDINGNLKTTATLTPSFIAAPGAAVPADTAWMGASDGANLRGLLVESSSVFNLRTGIWQGTIQAGVITANTVSYLQTVTTDQSASATISAADTGHGTIAVGTLSSTAPAASSFAQISISGLAVVGVTITGTITAGQLNFEASSDGTNFFTVNAIVPSSGAIVTSATASGIWRINCAGYQKVRVRAITGSTFSVNPLVALQANAGSSLITFAESLPAGSNTIGAVTGSGTFTVSGTVTANQGTANSVANGWPVKVTDGTNTMPTMDVAARKGFHAITDGTNTASVSAASALKVDGSAVTQPVSGTITANIGTSGSLALDATVAKLTIAQSTALGANTQALVGGSVTTSAPTYTTGNINPLSLTTAGLLRVDGSGVTQPVSGTVTANAGTGTFTVSGTVTANIGTSGSLALDATVAKLTIAQSAALGANTQALMGGSVTTSAPSYTTGNINPLSLTTSGALRVDASGTTSPVSGTVTANQGTANSLANGWPVKVTDGTNTMPTMDVAARKGFYAVTDGTNTATVKAASTAAVATDTALVVAISPNNPISVGTTDTTTGSTALGAGGATIQIALQGENGAGFQLATGTLIGTIVPEISFDGATTWVGTFFDDPVTSNKVSSIVFGSANTATARSIVGAFGASHARVRVSSYTSGTANATMRASYCNDPSALYGGASAATIQPPVVAQVGGWSGSNLVAMKIDASGLLLEKVTDGTNFMPTMDVAARAGFSKITDGTNTMPTMDVAARKGFQAITDGTNTATVTASSALKVDGSAVTQPVSGTITANIGTSGSLALDATVAKLTIAQSTALGANTQAMVGGSVTTTAPTYTTGNINPLSLTTAGSLRVDGSGSTQPVSGTVTANAGTGNFTVVQATAASLQVTNTPAGFASYGHITTATTTTLKSGAGVLRKIIIGNPGKTGATATIFDNTAGSGTTISVINLAAIAGQMEFDISFTTGLTVLTAGATVGDITVIYS